jgi:hypothetical protein
MKTSRALLSTVLFLALAPAARAVPASVSAVTLSTTTGLVSSIALDGFNAVHVSYFDPTDKAVKYVKWTNGSAVWGSTAAVDTNAHVHSTWTAMALDSARRPHVVFYDETSPSLRYARFNGTDWQVPVVIETFLSSAPYVALALNASDNPRVIYHHAESTTTKMGASEDGGVTWSTYTISLSTMVAPPDMAVDAAGRVHVISNFVGDLDSDTVLDHFAAYGVETAAGSGVIVGSIAAAYIVGSTSTAPGAVSLALGADGVAHMAVFDEDEGDLWYLKGTTTTLVMSTAMVTGFSGAENEIVLTSQGRPMIVYKEAAAGLKMIQCPVSNCDEDTDWSTPAVVLDASATAGDGLSLTRTSLNSALVAYFDGGVPELRFATNGGHNLSLSGTVLDAAAAPLSGVTVALAGSVVSASVVTGVGGTYSFANLLEGGYGVTPSRPGYGFMPGGRSYGSFNATLANQDFTGGPVGFAQVDNMIDPTAGEVVTMTVSLLDGDAFVGVYALNGRLVKVLMDENKTIGSYPVTWDGRNAEGEVVASGIYLVRVQTESFKTVQKVAVVK